MEQIVILIVCMVGFGITLVLTLQNDEDMSTNKPPFTKEDKR